jgi:hypothetical protein
MDRYDKRASKGRPRHERTEIKTAQGGRVRNNDYMLQYQNQTQWHPKTEAASWYEGREIVITVGRTVTLLRTRDEHIQQHYERQKWYSTGQAGNLEIEKGEGVYWRGKMPFMSGSKGKFHPITSPKRHKGGVEVWLYYFIKQNVRYEWIVNDTPRRPYPLKLPGTDCRGGWVGRSGRVRKFSNPTGFDPQTSQPVVSR